MRNDRKSNSSAEGHIRAAEARRAREKKKKDRAIRRAARAEARRKKSS